MLPGLAVLALGGAIYACGVVRGASVPPPKRPAPAEWSAEDLHVAYLGHASVLIAFGGVRILTDPVLYERIGVSLAGVTVGPRRLVRNALAASEIPRLDAVVISHAHMDSLDRASLARLATTPLLVVPARTRDLVDDLGYAHIVELGWGEQVEVGEVTVEAFEVAHWGKRWPWEGWRGYNGYLLSRGDVCLLFASDTAYTPAVGRIGHEHRVTAALVGNGAYDPWIANHASPEQVWQMFAESGARHLLPIHWDTFRLGKEPVGDAMTRLRTAAGDRVGQIAWRDIGATWHLPLGPEEGP